MTSQVPVTGNMSTGIPRKQEQRGLKDGFWAEAFARDQERGLARVSEVWNDDGMPPLFGCGRRASLEEHGPSFRPAVDGPAKPSARPGEGSGPAGDLWERLYCSTLQSSPEDLREKGFPQRPPDAEQGPADADAAHDRAGPFADALLNDFMEEIWAHLLLKAFQQPRTLLFLGAVHGEGATFVSFAMARFLSSVHQLRVLYVDTDLAGCDRSALIPDSSRRPGLTSFLLEGLPLDSLVRETQFDRLLVLPSGCGRIPPFKPGIDLSREAILANLIDDCHSRFDVTIFDGRPVVNCPGTLSFARCVDQTVLVFRHGCSRREVSGLAIRRMRDCGIDVTGVVLNHHPDAKCTGWCRIQRG
jgi:Mrp family chromosome partitioning ATPase